MDKTTLRVEPALPLRMPQSVLLVAIATELSAAGYVFYDGLMSIITSLL